MTRRRPTPLLTVCTVMLPVLLAPIALPYPSAAAVKCGEERWDVKTLSDGHADEVDFGARHTTVKHLRKIDRPAAVGSDDPRIKPTEFRTFKVKAKLIEAKKEDDRDIHVVVAEPHHAHKTMIVEFPSTKCKGAASSAKKDAMHRARKKLIDACGDIGSSDFKDLDGRAILKGVGFWDIPHGQTGAAPNQLELHPILHFKMVKGSCA